VPTLTLTQDPRAHEPLGRVPGRAGRWEHSLVGVSLPDVMQRSRAALRVGDAAEARRLLAEVDSEPASGEV
jgi:hypothetical protein